MWDAANCLFCNENPIDALQSLDGGYLGHVHMKDIEVAIHQATISNRSLGKGQMGPVLQTIANWLKQKNYDGSISLESVYRPKGGTFEDGFTSSIDTFKNVFG